jgi:hypothetical protein
MRQRRWFKLMLLSIINVQARLSPRTFRVRFVGCGPDEDAWLPFAETSPLSAFDKYLDEHPELRLGLA